MCSDVAGPSSSGSGDLFELSDRSNETDPQSLNGAMHWWTSSPTFLPKFGSKHLANQLISANTMLDRKVACKTTPTAWSFDFGSIHL